MGDGKTDKMTLELALYVALDPMTYPTDSLKKTFFLPPSIFLRGHLMKE